MKSDFSIYFHDGWAMLQVTPVELQVREIYVDEVSNRMKLLNISSVRIKHIQDILDRATGEPEKLALWPKGAGFSATVQVELSEDSMKAWLTAFPPKSGGEELTIEMIETALAEKEITHGINYPPLHQLVEKGLYNHKIEVASGTSIVPGKPKSIKYHFITKKVPFKELRNSRIDLKELNFIQNRKTGDLLAETIDSIVPIDGVTVTGKLLPADIPGKDELIIAGDNVQLTDDKLYAAIDGNAFIKAGKVHMESVVQLQNVDYGSGNIDFDGSVIIKGTIADGFEVKATGDVQVSKCVGRVKIHAERNLMLKSGVNGDKDAQLYSGGDTWSRYIESSSLLCRGDLMVSEAIMHSTLSVWGSLMLSGGRAEFMGGSLLVQGSFWCRKLGGLYEPPTSVIIGVSPEILQEYTHLLSQVQKKRSHLDNADTLITAMEKHPPGYINPEKKCLNDYKNEVIKLSEELGTLQKKSHQLRDEALPKESSVLVVEDRIFGRVHLSFGFKEYPLGNTGTKQVVLRCIKGKVVEKGFNPNDPPVVN